MANWAAERLTTEDKVVVGLIVKLSVIAPQSDGLRMPYRYEKPTLFYLFTASS